MDFYCPCGFQYNKEEFKKHFRNCEKFAEKYTNLDYAISKIISKTLKNNRNSKLLLFILERYIKLIKQKMKINRKSNMPNIEIGKKIYNSVYNFKNNFGDTMLNQNQQSHININNNYNIINHTQKDYYYNYNFNNNINNMLSYSFSSDIYNEFSVNNSSNLSLNLNRANSQIFTGNNKNESFLKPKYYSQINVQIMNHNLLLKGTGIKEDENKIIIDFCKKEYFKADGKLEERNLKNISNKLKGILFHEWLIIVSNNDNNDIYFNLSSSKCKNIVIFSIEDKKFQVLKL